MTRAWNGAFRAGAYAGFLLPAPGMVRRGEWRRAARWRCAARLSACLLLPSRMPLSPVRTCIFSFHSSLPVFAARETLSTAHAGNQRHHMAAVCSFRLRFAYRLRSVVCSLVANSNKRNGGGS
jgi:hypothetical protein